MVLPSEIQTHQYHLGAIQWTIGPLVSRLHPSVMPDGATTATWPGVHLLNCWCHFWPAGFLPSPLHHLASALFTDDMMHLFLATHPALHTPGYHPWGWVPGSLDSNLEPVKTLRTNCHYSEIKTTIFYAKFRMAEISENQILPPGCHLHTKAQCFIFFKKTHFQIHAKNRPFRNPKSVWSQGFG